MYATGLDDLIGSCPGDLRWDGEACSGEGAAVGDDEGVDANQLTVCIDQCAAGVSWIDCGVRLDIAAQLPRVIRVWVLTIDRAYDAACHRELEVAKRTAKGEHSLPGLQLRGVAPRDGGQVAGIDFDHSQIGKLVYADHLCAENAAIMQRHADLRSSVYDVIVSHDITIRGDDDTAADAMLQLRLLRRHASATV